MNTDEKEKKEKELFNKLSKVMHGVKSRVNGLRPEAPGVILCEQS